MKPDTHPEYHPVIFKDGDDEIVTRSTMTSKKTREVDGVEHYVIPLDISAFSHPFYTGKQKLVDTEGRVDRFMKRYNLQTEEEREAAGATDGVDNAEEAVEAASAAKKEAREKKAAEEAAAEEGAEATEE